MKLLSELYDVTLKRGIRGKASEGFIRPTIGENFMTHRDFEEIEKFNCVQIPDTSIYTHTSSIGSASALSDGVFDKSGDWTTGWAEQGQWANIDFGEQKTICKFGMHPRTDYSFTIFPEDFKLEASNDDSNWDVVLNTTTINNNDVNTAQYFDIEYPGSYRYYRLFVEYSIYGTLHGDSWVTVAEWYFFENI
jgi:hypothetical protein